MWVPYTHTTYTFILSHIPLLHNLMYVCEKCEVKSVICFCFYCFAKLKFRFFYFIIRFNNSFSTLICNKSEGKETKLFNRDFCLNLRQEEKLFHSTKITKESFNKFLTCTADFSVLYSKPRQSKFDSRR